MTAVNADREQDALDFMREVVSKLRRPKNVAKGDWRGMSCYALAELLRAEMVELRFAVSEMARRDSEETRDELVEECLDVAAFAFMISDVARRRGPWDESADVTHCSLGRRGEENPLRWHEGAEGSRG